MIVAPTPTNPRSPVRRVLRLGGLVVPVALLVVAVGAGLAGPRPEPDPEPVPESAARTLAPASSTGPEATPPAPGAVADLAGDPAPTQFGDLPVRGVTELLADDVDRPSDPSLALAVAGFLRVDGPLDAGCESVPRDPHGPWCDRTAILADATWAGGSTSPGGFPPHVHAVVPVGVRLPGVVGASVGWPAGGAPVVVVGRLVPSSGPCAGGRHACDEILVIDRFAWVDGVRAGVTPLVADRLDTGRRRANPFAAALDAADLPLLAVLAWPDAIPSLDPDAASAAAAGPPSEPVWYVRILDGARGPGPDRHVRWVLLTERELRVIDSGRPGEPGAPRLPDVGIRTIGDRGQPG